MYKECIPVRMKSDKTQSKIEMALVNKDLHLALGNGIKSRTIHYLRQSIFSIGNNNLRSKKLNLGKSVFCANQIRCDKANSNAPSYGICHTEYTEITYFLHHSSE